METTRKLTELNPEDLPFIERLFGRALTPTADAVIVLRTPEIPAEAGTTDSDELPAWCNVLEGMSDTDRDEFRAILNSPVRLAQPG